MPPTRPALVDHLGREIDFTVLREELTVPSVVGARPIVGGHPASGLTPARLGGILRQAEAGSPRAYLELAEEIEEKDLHYLGVLGTRKRQVSQLEITVEAASDDADDQANADLVREWLDRDTLEDDLFDILDAVGKGFSVTEIIWEMSERQWWPARLEYVQSPWIEFDKVTGRTPLLIRDDGQPAPLEPWKFIVHQVKAKSGLPIRSGLARPASWAWMFKNYMVKDWVAFAEVYGMPFRIGKYDANASPDDKRTLLRAVASLGSDAAAIIPKSMEIAFESSGGEANGALFQGGAEWFDRQMSKAVLGQTATTDADTGGLGSGKEHGEVREDIERADAKGLAATLNRDIIRPLVDANRGPPKSGQYPKVRVGRAGAWDPAKMMPAVESFVSMGGRVSQSVIADRLGLPDAGDDEEILTPPQRPAEGPGKPSDGPGAVQPQRDRARPASHASQGRSRPQETPAEPDPIDRLIEQEVGDGGWIIAPLLAGLQDLADEAGDLETLRDRLAGHVAEMDVTDVAELLARASFNARLAGAAGLDMNPTEEDA